MAGFSQEIIQAAQQTQKDYGVPASLTLAQWAEESGWGKSTLARTGNNFFGVKAGSKWSGGTVRVGGNTYRAYSSAYESFVDHAKVLHNGYYPIEGLSSSDSNAWINAIDGIYAENPSYASNLRKLISTYNLTQYDGAGGTFTVTGTGTTSDTAAGGGNASGVLATIAKFTFIAGLLVLGVLFILSAFGKSTDDLGIKIGGSE